MKNFVQAGNSITVAAPAAVASGDFLTLGELRGVAATDAEIGVDVAISTIGVFSLPKEATTDTFAVGAPVEWDGVNGRVAALTSGDRCGVVVKAAGATVPSPTISQTSQAM